MHKIAISYRQIDIEPLWSTPIYFLWCVCLSLPKALYPALVEMHHRAANTRSFGKRDTFWLNQPTDRCHAKK